ncbi:MAG: FAD-dependent oxidoreductase [Oscillospiraceae bacterium]|jgi:NAD(P)H-nitrite reductase large subunit|nr:FAD-dependent oxidoreductase [Oscillospiraceae bacterium]
MKYLIIGNSAGGIGAVEGIRQIDKEGGITVISNEPYHTYSRPLISYLLLGKITEDKRKYRGADFYAKNNVKLVHGTVKRIYPEDKQVILSGGEQVSYDKLMVAAGSSPFVPPFEGLDGVPAENRFAFMCLDDALNLNKALDKNKRVLIVGAGLIGLKCAEGILEKVAGVTVVDLAPRILSSILDDYGAKPFQELLESKGIEFRLSRGVKRFEGRTAVLDDGETVDFDILVLAVGVRPNTALLKDIAEIDKGIVINEKSETTAPDIYAAGDCVQTVDASSGESKIMALLPNAYIQGECAGINMAGGEKSFNKAIPMNAIGFFGLHVVTAGNYTGDKLYTEREGNGYKRLFYGDNKLNGFILVGNVEKAGIYTSLIRERTPLDSIDFALVCKKPGMMAFTREERNIKLGGGAV